MKASNPLEEIKNTWKGLSNEKLKKEVSTRDIKKIIRKKSTNELAKVKRKLIIEALANLVSLPIFIIILHNKFNNYVVFVDIFLIVTLAIYFFPIISFYKIGKLRYQETKKYLRKFIYRLKRFIKYQIVFASFIIPLAIVIGFILAKVGIEKNTVDLSVILNTSAKTIIIYIAALIGISLFLMLLIKFIYRGLYSKHISTLSNYLWELQKHENETIIEETNNKSN